MAVPFRPFFALLVVFFAFGCHQDLRIEQGLEIPDAEVSDSVGSDDADDAVEAGAVPDGGNRADARPRVDSGGKGDGGDNADLGHGNDDADPLDAGPLDAGPLDAGHRDSGRDADDANQTDGGDAVDTGDQADSGGQADTGAQADTSGDTTQPPPSDPACLAADSYPSTLLNPPSLASRQGQLQFVARDGNTLNAYTHRSPLFNPATGKIVFIMHGANRNADTYLDKWRSEVDQHNVLAIAPEFPKSLYPGSEDYQLGVGTSGTPYTGTYRAYQWRDSDDFTHSEIEHLFEAVRGELGNSSCRYSIYGHSAGGQFVHRLLTFRPDARVETAVAANAGWYTLPSDGGGYDRNFYMPYGLQGAPPDSTRLEKLFAHNLVVLLGEDDVNRGSYLRTTTEADAQGQNRLERGQFYYATAQQEASDEGVPFHWTLDIVPNVGHSTTGMTPAAAAHIFGP